MKGRPIPLLSLPYYYCLLYDPLKWNLIALKMNIIIKRKYIIDTVIVNNITGMCPYFITRGHRISMTQWFPLNKSDIIY